MTLDELPTPSLILDRSCLQRNTEAMTARLKGHGVALRPHMKTAKSIDVARLALAGNFGGITVSTLEEARYFARNQIVDIVYGVGIVPAKLEFLAEIQGKSSENARISLILDDPGVA
jgi:D-serine deaminase-like pyridoxal phosphate-dependent protein